MLEGEYRCIEPVYPTTTFTDSLVIHQKNREVHLLHPGRGNTAGDIVMWLPAERIVATGDMVVRPTPYGFGSYPREWAQTQTQRRLMELDFQVLVPGHGDIHRDTRYVRLLIETLDLVAGQMDALVAEDLTGDEAIERVDFSAVEERFTGGDAFLAGRFLGWFKIPIARGEPPENIQPQLACAPRPVSCSRASRCRSVSSPGCHVTRWRQWLPNRRYPVLSSMTALGAFSFTDSIP